MKIMLLRRMMLSSWLVLFAVVDSVHGSLVLNSSMVNNGGREGRNLLRSSSSSSSHFPLEQSLTTTRTEPLPSVQQLEPAAIPPRKLQTTPTGSVGYGTDGVDLRLYEVDLQSGNAILIGNITGTAAANPIFGLTFCPIDEKLYGINFFSSPLTLFTVDTSNAVATPVVNVTGLSETVQFLSITSPSDDDPGQCQFILGTTGGSLFTFNATDGMATDVGKLPNRGLGGEVDCQGDFLWTSVDEDSFDTDFLYKTNLSTNQSVAVGDTGISINGLAFDCCNDQLYAFEDNGFLYTVNSTTGESTPILGDSTPGFYTAGAIVPNFKFKCQPTPSPSPAPTTADKKCYYDEQADSHYSSSEFLAGGTEFHVGDLCKDLSYTIKVCCAVQEEDHGYVSPEESGTTSSTTTSTECVTCDQCTVDQVVNDACCAWAWWDDDSKYNDQGGDNNRRNLNGIYEGGCITKYGDESQCCKCNDFYKCIGANDNCAEEC